MTKDIGVRVGVRIRALRTKRRWSQAMLADHAGITREHLSELERGKKEPGILILDRIVQALDLSLRQFFDDL